MPVRVKNSKTGSDSGKKPVCVQAPLGFQEDEAPRNFRQLGQTYALASFTPQEITLELI